MIFPFYLNHSFWKDLTNNELIHFPNHCHSYFISFLITGNNFSEIL